MIELVAGVVELFNRQRIFLGVKTNCDACHRVVFARTWEVGDEKTAEENLGFTEIGAERARRRGKEAKIEIRKWTFGNQTAWQDAAVVP